MFVCEEVSKSLALADVSHHRPRFPYSSPLREMSASRGDPLITLL